MNNGISAALIVDVIELAFMLIATHLTVKSLIYSGRIKTSHWYISIPMFFAFLILKSSIGNRR